ncbi:hypothetical protein [Mycoplasmopsis phocirhinis]|uniref:hypothetical protein n=1 Tax=Mycoplasmopsis phocirhinis TaxID=142650 RepID=UPI0013EE4D81|nr:hypothetical protein [Mycoplasmopsis phocirhinis]
MRPDVIYKNNFDYLVIDAKYYQTNSPGTSDYFKQFNYADVINNYITQNVNNQVYNIYILPAFLPENKFELIDTHVRNDKDFYLEKPYTYVNLYRFDLTTLLVLYLKRGQDFVTTEFSSYIVQNKNKKLLN